MNLASHEVQQTAVIIEYHYDATKRTMIGSLKTKFNELTQAHDAYLLTFGPRKMDANDFSQKSAVVLTIEAAWWHLSFACNCASQGS